MTEFKNYAVKVVNKFSAPLHKKKNIFCLQKFLIIQNGQFYSSKNVQNEIYEKFVNEIFAQNLTRTEKHVFVYLCSYLLRYIMCIL